VVIPGWLEVALEGRGLRLQRAFADYRALRRLFEGQWRAQAIDVANRCQALRGAGFTVDEAIERARRRARQDLAAQSALGLVEAVERERDRLFAAATAVSAELELQAAPEGLSAMLSLLEPALREEGFLELAWRRFRSERAVLTALVVAAGAAIPIISWLEASFGGQVPTLFALEALTRGSSRQLILLWTVLVLVFRWRLSVWGFLGIQPPTMILPAVAAALGGSAGFVAATQVVPNAETAILVASIAALISLTGAVAISWWRRK
jgi:hypothetical protein